MYVLAYVHLQVRMLDDSSCVGYFCEIQVDQRNPTHNMSNEWRMTDWNKLLCIWTVIFWRVLELRFVGVLKSGVYDYDWEKAHMMSLFKKNCIIFSTSILSLGLF